jgi:hypothetical protein
VRRSTPASEQSGCTEQKCPYADGGHVPRLSTLAADEVDRLWPRLMQALRAGSKLHTGR